MDITIGVLTHKAARMPKDPLYLPIQVGSAGKIDLGYTRDDSGDNISDKNNRYSELTGIYWAWKNLSCDYIGFCHYRRYFAGEKKRAKDPFANILTSEEAAALCSKASIIVPKKRNYYVKTLAGHFLSCSFAEPDDVDDFRSAVLEVTPEYAAAFDEVMARRSGHMANMFIMSWEKFGSFATWLFAVMDVLDGRIAPERTRMLGYFAEHMLDIWMCANQLDCIEIGSVFTDGENELRKKVGYVLRLFGAKKLSDAFVRRQK